MANERNSESTSQTETPGPANIIAWAGIGFGVVAALLYCVLFYMLSRLPSTRNQIEELRTNAPALTRLLMVGSAAGLLNVVSLILCLAGYILPQRSRWEATVGSIASALMLLAVFSVVFASLMLVP